MALPLAKGFFFFTSIETSFCFRGRREEVSHSAGSSAQEVHELSHVDFFYVPLSDPSLSEAANGLDPCYENIKAGLLSSALRNLLNLNSIPTFKCCLVITDKVRFC